MLGLVYGFEWSRALMKHWLAVLPIKIMEVRYEELVNHQEEVSRAMIEFCGLEWDDRCLRFYENQRIAHTASINQVREGMYSRSIGRWKHYDRHLAPLKTALLEE